MKANFSKSGYNKALCGKQNRVRQNVIIYDLSKDDLTFVKANPEHVCIKCREAAIAAGLIK